MAHTAAAALAVVVGVAALLAGCTVGPSQRPPVAVRGENMPVLPTSDTPVLPSPPGLPQPQDQDPAIRFRDCTATSLATLTTPPDRALQVDCGEITLAADIDRIDLGGVTLDVIEVAAADAPDTRPPLLVIGDSAGEASARAALVLATQVDPASPFWFGLSTEETAEAYPWDEYILARSRVGEIPAAATEDDLFAEFR